MELVDAHKREAQKQWNSTPCGTGDFLRGLEYGSLSFFDEIRRSRYEDSDPWMRRVIPFHAAQGKRLLEIGHGIGSDLLTFAEAGAEVYGIDITQEHHQLARRNFELHGREVTLKRCDAAAIDFPSQFFDIVYSNGVLHHTPDTVRCISEAYRVLKPGGNLILSMYHTYSFFHLVTMVCYHGLLRGNLRRLGYRGLMATLEHGADGIAVKPLVKTYGRRELRHILSDFKEVRLEVTHLTRDQVPVVRRFVPAAALRLLEPIAGWYVVAFATK